MRKCNLNRARRNNEVQYVVLRGLSENNRYTIEEYFCIFKLECY